MKNWVIEIKSKHPHAPLVWYGEDKAGADEDIVLYQKRGVDAVLREAKDGDYEMYMARAPYRKRSLAAKRGHARRLRKKSRYSK